MKNTQKVALVFDGSCPFCTACAEFLHVLDWRHGLDCLPFQAPGVPESYGLSVSQCEQTAWTITADSRVYQGAQAASAALDAIIPLPIFLYLCRLPGINHVEDKVYAWVAKNRTHFPGIRPYCERPGKPCGK